MCLRAVLGYVNSIVVQKREGICCVHLRARKLFLVFPLGFAKETHTHIERERGGQKEREHLEEIKPSVFGHVRN